MSQLVEVKGVGLVEFPDNMSPEQIGSALDEEYGAKPSAAKSALGGFLRGLLPTAAFIPGAEAGAAIGAAVGGPFAEITAPIGGFIGGVATTMAAKKLQDKTADAVAPESIMGTQEEAAELEAHPYLTRGGEVLSGGASLKAAPFKMAGKLTAAGMGAAVATVPALLQGRLPTGPELAENIAFPLLYGQPRFRVPMPKFIGPRPAGGTTDATGLREGPGPVPQRGPEPEGGEAEGGDQLLVPPRQAGQPGPPKAPITPKPAPPSAAAPGTMPLKGRWENLANRLADPLGEKLTDAQQAWVDAKKGTPAYDLLQKRIAFLKPVKEAEIKAKREEAEKKAAALPQTENDKLRAEGRAKKVPEPKDSGELAPDDWGVIVQPNQVAEGKEIPGTGYIQLGDREGKVWSSRPQVMQALGWKVPTTEELMKLPAGNYSLAQVREMLGKGKMPEPPQAAPLPKVPARDWPKAFSAWKDTKTGQIFKADSFDEAHSDVARKVGRDFLTSDRIRSGEIQQGFVTEDGKFLTVTEFDNGSKGWFRSYAGFPRFAPDSVKAEAAKTAPPPAPPAAPVAAEPPKAPEPTPPAAPVPDDLAAWKPQRVRKPKLAPPKLLPLATDDMWHLYDWRNYLFKAHGQKMTHDQRVRVDDAMEEARGPKQDRKAFQIALDQVWHQIQEAQKMELPKLRKGQKSYGKKGREIFDRETEIVGEDILSWIDENGSLLSREMAKKKYPDRYRANSTLWDDAPEEGTLDPLHASLIYSEKGSFPDQLARDAGDLEQAKRGMRPGLKTQDVTELWEAIKKGSAARVNARRGGEAQALKLEEQKAVEFSEATSKEKAPPDAEAKPAKSLSVGDLMEVEGQRVKVVKVYPNGTVVLEDGRKFGTQSIGKDTTIYVEKYEPNWDIPLTDEERAALQADPSLRTEEEIAADEANQAPPADYDLAKAEAEADAQGKTQEAAKAAARAYLEKQKGPKPPEPPTDLTQPGAGEPRGPGTAHPSDIPEGGDALHDLTQAIHVQRTSYGKASPADPLRAIAEALDLADAWARGKSAVLGAIGKLRATSAALKESYVNLPKWRDYEAAIGRWTGADSVASSRVFQFVREINRYVPSRLRQAAITNWIQAQGDEALLRQRAAASRPDLRKAYEAALTLTDSEKTLGRQIEIYLDERLQEAIESGLLSQGVDHYVTQIWRKPNLQTQKLWTDLFGTGNLNPTFQFAKKRIFESYFEGEQAGFVPKDKRISALIGVYDLAFNRSLAARGVIKELYNGVAEDGRPITELSGKTVTIPRNDVYGDPLPPGTAPAAAFLIKPHARPSEAVAADGRPYRVIDHWAMRNWKWAAKGQAGENVFLQGDMLVHPDHYASLKNALGSSRLRQVPFTRALLTAGAFAKQTKLSLSPFHVTQEGVHAVAHRVNPLKQLLNSARGKEIDLNDPLNRKLLDHGLVIGDTRAQELFMEGMTGGGLVGKIPGLGKLQVFFNDLLFKDFIPRLKIEMARDAYTRNSKGYAKDLASGKITESQVLALTARESNAAFGELNYRLMGRSPVLQDIFRLTGLAPDFLEARFRFVAQALTPYGREQRIALGLMAGAMFVAGRVLNQLLDGDPHWNRPFSLVVKGREYRLRTLVGDVQHLVNDPRSFWYNRMSPFLRTATEYVTGRDDRGIKRTSAEQLVDLAAWFRPISTQSRSDQTHFESMLTSAGVSARQYGAQQQLYKVLDDWRSKQTDPRIKEQYDRQRQETHVDSVYTPLRHALLINDQKAAKKAYQELRKSRTPGRIYEAMNTAYRPVTGSWRAESMFTRSLNPQEKQTYAKAREERKEIYRRFLSLMRQR